MMRVEPFAERVETDKSGICKSIELQYLAAFFLPLAPIFSGLHLRNDEFAAMFLRSALTGGVDEGCGVSVDASCFRSMSCVDRPMRQRGLSAMLSKREQILFRFHRDFSCHVYGRMPASPPFL